MRTSEPFIVRTAAIEDARAVEHVRRRTWQVAYAHIFPAQALAEQVGGEWWEQAIRNPRPHMRTVVAERGGVVTGFASLGVTRDEEASSVGELFAIYVLPDEWGLGVGQALMAETLKALRDEGFAEAILWVLEDNPRTRHFYELAGWRADGGVKDEDLLETRVHEVRYRITLEHTA